MYTGLQQDLHINMAICWNVPTPQLRQANLPYSCQAHKDKPSSHVQHHTTKVFCQSRYLMKVHEPLSMATKQTNNENIQVAKQVISLSQVFRYVIRK